MAGLTPDKLRQAADLRSTIAKPSAEGIKATTFEVAKGAAQGAVTGGWVGAAKGAAVSFAKTKAGRRIIAVLLVLALVTTLTLPVGMFISLTAVTNAAAYGDQYRAGEAAVGSGKEQAEVSAAMAAGAEYDIQWPVYLAMVTVVGEEKTDSKKLAEVLNDSQIRTIGAGAVVVSGSGLTAGKTDSEKALAQTEKQHYLDALTEYGLEENEAKKVYSIALKWALGEKESCTATEVASTGQQDTTQIVTSDGKTFNLTTTQTSNVKQILGFAAKIPGITPEAVLISLMAAMTESGLKNYANKNVPESLNFPHDAIGEDHDSVGFWQMRQHWGTTAELMDIGYQVKAFFGGPEGPNKGSPRGLFDIPGWESLTKGEAAQAVEVSAYPDRYNENETLAVALLARFGSGMTFCDGGLGLIGAGGHPMGDPKFLVVSGYGQRTPGAGSSNHKGIDFQAGCNTPIFAIAAGTVIHDGPEGGWGNSVQIDHGNGLVTRSAHMPNGGKWVKEGSKVEAGAQIGTVGSTGNSSGCHLHFETLIDSKYYDPAVVLKDLGVELRWDPEANGRPAAG